MPDNDDVSREEANHLFQESDDDHDELLRYIIWVDKIQSYFRLNCLTIKKCKTIWNPLFYSFDEIVAHHEIFTGSEATDFGEHLTLQQMKRFEEEL